MPWNVLKWMVLTETVAVHAIYQAEPERARAQFSRALYPPDRTSSGCRKWHSTDASHRAFPNSTRPCVRERSLLDDTPTTAYGTEGVAAGEG